MLLTETGPAPEENEMTRPHDPSPPSRGRSSDGDDDFPDRDDDRPEPRSYRTNAGEVIGTAKDAAESVSRFTPAQTVTFLLIAVVIFILGSQTYQSVISREETRLAAQERKEAAATSIRENNAQRELDRQQSDVRERRTEEQQTSRDRDMRAWFSGESEKRMRFESDERAKDRVVIAALAVEKAEDRKAIAALIASVDELRKVLLKKHEEEGCPLPP